MIDPSVEVTHVMVIRSTSSGTAVVVLHCYCSYDGYALVGLAASLGCRCDGEAQPRLQPLPMSSSGVPRPKKFEEARSPGQRLALYVIELVIRNLLGILM